MKRKISLLLITFFSLANGAILMAQSAKVDFKKVFEKYAQVENLSLTMEAYSYADAKSTESNLVFKGSFKKRDNRFYTKAWDREVIVNGNEMLVVNHEDKTIAIGRARPLDARQMAIPAFSIDSLEAHGGIVAYIGKQNDKRKYTITMPDAMIYSTDLYIDDSDIIVQIVYHYQEWEEGQPAYSRLEIFYKNVSFEPAPMSFFDRKKFFNKDSNGDFQTSAAFADYFIREVDYTSYSNYEF